MYDLFIAYDTASGRIVGVHYGPTASDYVWRPDCDPDLHVAVLRGSFPDLAAGKQYAVDTARRTLVEVEDDAQGISFAFQRTGGISQKPCS